MCLLIKTYDADQKDFFIRKSFWPESLKLYAVASVRRVGEKLRILMEMGHIYVTAVTARGRRGVDWVTSGRRGY